MVNVTTREHIWWTSQRHASVPPLPASALWASYAPHDKGLLLNVLTFMHARREGTATWDGMALRDGEGETEELAVALEAL